MKLNYLALSMAVSAALTLSACSNDDDKQVATPKRGEWTAPVNQSGNPAAINSWYNAGVDSVASANSAWQKDTAATALSTGKGKAKNVILFVGDGMGMSTVTAARILEGQITNPNGGEEHKLSFEHFPFTGLAKTYNTDAQTPDSAGTMTAMMTGVKSFAGGINIAETANRSDCDSSKGKELTTALDLAKMAGMKAGIISTARITHATPAATYSRVPERGWENDTETAAGCLDIAQQMINYDIGGGLDVVLGGGQRNFTLPETGGRRADQDLTQVWQTTNPTGSYVTNRDEFVAVDPSNTSKLLGLFNSSHMDYEADRVKYGADSEPSLAEMTEKAIEVMQDNEDGFFLMVEAGRIDHAHHGGNAHRALKDTLAFSDAVAMADKLTSDDDTLIIVTADHSHVFTIAGYPRRGNPILGLVENQDGSLQTAADDKPYTTLGYTNGPGASASFADGERVDLTEVAVQGVDFQQQAIVPTGSETHAGEDVPVYAKGPASSLVRSTLEQNEIFHIMNYAGNLLERANAAQ
ncbi:alkaline phosphatase [Agarivorans sp. TSD2052]|uniref:alkaline phosphatase n=1 Tax=Agarivorans sp. TSD2052 TaxID=2937286 RepID=UPI00200D40E8|nr:alkaline phosphatase [Agarivorans sp. TSD2052]UPW17456.1 alkaline phosphatase [Agarivorans sp. TSD2052]